MNNTPRMFGTREIGNASYNYQEVEKALGHSIPTGLYDPMMYSDKMMSFGDAMTVAYNIQQMEDNLGITQKRKDAERKMRRLQQEAELRERGMRREREREQWERSLELEMEEAARRRVAEGMKLERDSMDKILEDKRRIMREKRYGKSSYSSPVEEISEIPQGAPENAQEVNYVPPRNPEFHKDRDYAFIFACIIFPIIGCILAFFRSLA